MEIGVDSYDLEAGSRIAESAREREETERKRRQAKERDYDFRCKIIQEYFLRMSQENKKKFLLLLIKNLRRSESIETILHLLSVGYAKLAVYLLADPVTNYLNDKLTVDTNRMLDKNTLAETIETDLMWFTKLESESQIFLVVELLRKCVGNMEMKLYVPLLRIREYHNTAKKPLIAHVKSRSILKQYSTIFDLEVKYDDETEYDQNNPVSVEVRRKRNTWNEVINKYKNYALENYLEKTEKGQKQDTKGQKTKIDSLEEVIDWMQLLPIWIVKKILGFLNPKSLQTAEKINKYWKYAIDEFNKERKNRKKLDAALEKIKENIKQENLQKCTFMDPPQKVYKRFQPFDRSGITKKLIPKISEGLVEESIYLDTLLKSQTTEESDIFNRGEPSIFPRQIKEDMLLHRREPDFIRENEILMTVAEDLDRQRSYLSYSISSEATNFLASLELSSISDW